MAVNPFQYGLPATSKLSPKEHRRVSQIEFTLPSEKPVPQVSFQRATKNFGESLRYLSEADRAAIRVIQNDLDRAHPGGGEKRLGRFLVGVMNYAHSRVSELEKNPGTALPGECQRLENVFDRGFKLVEAFAALPEN